MAPSLSLLSVLILLVSAAAARGQAPANPLSDEDIRDGWTLLFDGADASHWRIEGGHEVADGTLILGGTTQTRAYLPLPARCNWEIRFEYRTDGKDSGGIGWDYRKVPQPTIPHLSPSKAWRESFVLEYFDLRHFQQRFIKGQHGTSGVFAPISTLWIEVPAGNRLFLRNIRFRETARTPWPWLLAMAVACLTTVMVLLWRWKRKVQTAVIREKP